MPNLVGTEDLIRKRLGGRYGIERLKNIPDGPVPAIFKALSKKKGVSIPAIYKKAGKDVDVTKVSFRKDYRPFLVSKKVVGIKEFFSEPKIGFLFIPLNVHGTDVELQTFAFKGYEEDFKKIGELTHCLNQLTINQVSIEKDFEETPALVSDEVYENIKNMLPQWGYTVKEKNTRKIRGALAALRAIENAKGKPNKVPVYTHYYAAFLISKKESLLSTEKRICLLLVPRRVEMGESSIDIIEFEGSGEKVLKLKSLICKMSNLPCAINFVWSAPKGIKIP